jgi:xanthine dehydrogenase YagS FAD-binding subunit
MKSFKNINVRSVQEAASLLTKYGAKAKVIAGGSDLLPLMKDRILTPEVLINLKTIPEIGYVREGDQELRIGALTTLREVETHPGIKQKIPLLSQVAAETASPQIRNVGTIVGNLCQRPWCWYFRGPLFPCLRKGGSMCLLLQEKINTTLS